MRCDAALMHSAELTDCLGFKGSGHLPLPRIRVAVVLTVRYIVELVVTVICEVGDDKLTALIILRFERLSRLEVVLLELAPRDTVQNDGFIKKRGCLQDF